MTKFRALNLFLFVLSIGLEQSVASDYTIPLNNETVHWGYFSKSIPPVLTVDSGSTVTVEMATHHGCDDWDKMIKGDPGMESVFTWTPDYKFESFRGASGSGDGVHVLTGPIYVNDAEPGDVLKVEILDLYPRKNTMGKTYGSNAAAWWGFQARVNKIDGTSFKAGDFTGTPSTNDEIVTIYEVIEEDGKSFVIPSYQFEWPNITDPNGIDRNFIAYPGKCEYYLIFDKKIIKIENNRKKFLRVNRNLRTS